MSDFRNGRFDMNRDDQNHSPSRFKEFLKLHLRRQRFLTQEQEARLLEEAVLRYNLTADEANGVLRAATDDAEVVTEAELISSTVQLLKAMSDKRNRITREDFDKAADFYRSRTGTSLTPIEARKRVKRIMEEHSLEPRRSGHLLKTRRWYRQIGE
jgi:hypothetical protein